MASNADFVQYIADQCSRAGGDSRQEDVWGLWEILRWDDRYYLSELVRETCKELLAPKPKRK